MLKNSKDPKKEEKIKNYEEKKEEELTLFQKEHSAQKDSQLKEIKDKFNELGRGVKIDA